MLLIRLSDQAISFTRNIGFKEIEVNLGAYLSLIHGHPWKYPSEAVEKQLSYRSDALSDLKPTGRELSQQAKKVNFEAKD